MPNASFKKNKSDDTICGVSFNTLVKTYQERLYWHIRMIVMNHDDANDILQNTFLRAWKSKEKFRGNSKIYTWLYRIATNESITFLNAKKKRNTMQLNDVNEYLLSNLISDPYFEGDEIQMKLHQAVLRLPEKQRIVFNMKYFEDMRYEAISEILDTSVGGLKASYHHAVKKVEEYLKNND